MPQLTPEQEARLNRLFTSPPLKRFMVIEIPREDTPEVSLAIGEISQYATQKLHAIGVDPVRSTFVFAESINEVRGC